MPECDTQHNYRHSKTANSHSISFHFIAADLCDSVHREVVACLWQSLDDHITDAPTRYDGATAYNVTLYKCISAMTMFDRYGDVVAFDLNA